MSTLTSVLTLVTVVAETVLEEQICTQMRDLGVTGFTISDVRGEGSKNLNAGEIPGNKIKIESIVDKDLAQKVMKFIRDEYFPNYSVIVYSQEVNVLREKKFVKGQQNL